MVCLQAIGRSSDNRFRSGRSEGAITEVGWAGRTPAGNEASLLLLRYDAVLILD